MAMSTSAMMGIAHQPLRSAPRTSRFTPAPARPRLTRFTTVAMAAPDFLIKKLESSERTHKELTFRLADPDVASDAKEFQKLSKALGELTGVVDMYARYKECQAEEAEAVYRADLGLDPTLSRACQHPGNPWSLHGLHECLVRRGAKDEAMRGGSPRIVNRLAVT